jgi:hypothetical protein
MLIDQSGQSFDEDINVLIILAKLPIIGISRKYLLPKKGRLIMIDFNFLAVRGRYCDDHILGGVEC